MTILTNAQHVVIVGQKQWAWLTCLLTKTNIVHAVQTAVNLWYEIDGDGTPYDSPVELSTDDFEYIKNLYNEYMKNHQ